MAECGVTAMNVVNFPNIIGISGVFLVLLAYCLLQIGRLSQRSVKFSLCNFIGSVFILYSLYFYWNLSSGIIEIAWLLISFYGLIKSIRLRYSLSQSQASS